MQVSQRLVQTIISAVSPTTLSRIRTSEGVWSDWYRLDNFGCSTPADLASLLGGVSANGSIDIDASESNLPTKNGVWWVYASSLWTFSGKAGYLLRLLGIESQAKGIDVWFEQGSPDTLSAVYIRISVIGVLKDANWYKIWETS